MNKTLWHILAICQNFKKNDGTLKFQHGSQRENIKCGISRKRMFLEQNGRKFGTRGTTVHIGRVLLKTDSLSLVRGHLVQFAQYQIL